MTKIDLKKSNRALFGPPTGNFVEIAVPTLTFVKVDGAGNPNTAPSYASALQWLYGVSYAMKFAAKASIGCDYVVPPLEALWWADDPASFVRREKDNWRWTVMLMAPAFVSPTMFNNAVARTMAKRGTPPASLRFEDYTEGRSLQTLHVGSYDDEGPVLRRLHEEIMPDLGVHFNGAHHEIYLSDLRRTDPSKLKTILRQPIRER